MQNNKLTEKKPALLFDNSRSHITHWQDTICDSRTTICYTSQQKCQTANGKRQVNYILRN